MCYPTQKRNICFFFKIFFFTLLVWILKYSINSTCEFCSNKYNLGTTLDLRVKRILSDCTHLLKSNKSESKVNLLDEAEKENIAEKEVQQKTARDILLAKKEEKIDISDQSKNGNTTNKKKEISELAYSICLNAYFCFIVPILLFTLTILKETINIPYLSNELLTNLFLMHISVFLSIIFIYIQ
ncbi:fam-h protein [Plasmodium relictum]|uniref:Fam-h protein n=1 Tax=Plasmodium relictum TaxID=85471 RepID=A0A1J1GKF7_PLARL|nr:fam-h protein [Plasmodium relictum]CRG85005.1 fam-h protein [Plasmodium relictum]